MKWSNIDIPSEIIWRILKRINSLRHFVISIDIISISKNIHIEKQIYVYNICFSFVDLIIIEILCNNIIQKDSSSFMEFLFGTKLHMYEPYKFIWWEELKGKYISPHRLRIMHTFKSENAEKWKIYWNIIKEICMYGILGNGFVLIFYKLKKPTHRFNFQTMFRQFNIIYL